MMSAMATLASPQKITFAEMRETVAAGKTSLRAIAEGLNAQGIPTSRGQGEWSATQVMRVLERLDPFVAEGGASEASSLAA
jgi:hypothetical protein